MVKKLKKLAEKQAAPTAGMFDGQLAQSVKESAQQIWLAGMGAFAKAQEEGGKVFEALVREGQNLQRKTQSAAEQRMGAINDKVSAMAGEVGARAGQQWDKLESIFEERTAKAMGRLGVPTAADVQALSARVDALEAKIAKLAKGAAAPKAAVRRGATKPAAEAEPAAVAKTVRRAPRKAAPKQAAA